MKNDCVAVLDVRSYEVTFLIGGKGVNDTFVQRGSKSEKYEGFTTDGFLDEESFCRAVSSCVSSVLQNYDGTISEICVGTPSAFTKIYTKGQTISFPTRRKLSAEEFDALYEAGLAELTVPGRCVKRSSMYFSLGDNRKYFTIDGVNHTRGFVLSTCVYLSLDAGGLIGAGSFGIAGFVGGALALMALAASSEVSQASFACFNLQKQYKTMTFNVGVLDNDKGSDGRKQPYDTLYVIADDKIVGEYKLTSNMATTEITVDVANCERLTFWLDHNSNSPSYGIFDATLTK